MLRNEDLGVLGCDTVECGSSLQMFKWVKLDLRARGYCSFYHQGMIIYHGNAHSRIL
jgi:hypothetical protein